MSEPLSEEERQALRDWWDSESEADSAGTMLANLDATVAAILAARTQALEAEVERLKRGGEELGKSLVYWLELAQKVTDSDDVIADDGDGDWAVVAERLAALGSRAAAAEAERDRIRAGIEALCDEWDGYSKGATPTTVRLRALLDGVTP